MFQEHGTDQTASRDALRNQEMTTKTQYNPEFDDWVDKVYGFMHFLNPTHLQIASSDKNATFTSEAIDNPNITNDSVSTDPFMYECIP